jgi:hypothetical protein
LEGEAMLTNILWAFGRRKYTSYEEFALSVTNQNKWANPDEAERSLAQPISEGPIRVLYDPVWIDGPPLEFQIGIVGRTLTAGKLLFELNTATFDLFRDADRHFFEGLRQTGPSEYWLRTGS